MRVIAAVVCLFLMGCGSSATSKATYPEPRTEYLGRNAQEWGRRALDANRETWADSIEPLKVLKGEGVPYLLAGMEAHEHNAGLFLEAIDGRLVHPADLPRVAVFLKGNLDFTTTNVLRIIEQAGPNARPLVPQLKAMTTTKDKEWKERLAKTLKAVE